jgi:hypothetical protein
LDPPEPPPLDDIEFQRIARRTAIKDMRKINFHYYQREEKTVKRRISVKYIRHRTVPRYQSTDLRVDSMRQVDLKHPDPLHVWFEVEQVDCLRISNYYDLYCDLGFHQKEEVEVSYEYMVQLLGPGAFNLTYDDEMSWTRTAAMARGMSTVNINRYAPPLVVGNSVALADKFSQWTRRKVRDQQGFQKPQGNVEQSNTVTVLAKSPFRMLDSLAMTAGLGCGLVLTTLDAAQCVFLWGTMLSAQAILKLVRRTWPQQFPELLNVWPVLRPFLTDRYCSGSQLLSGNGVPQILPRWNRIQMLALRLGCLPLIIQRRARNVFGERMICGFLMGVMLILARRRLSSLLSSLSLMQNSSHPVGFIRGRIFSSVWSGLFLGSWKRIFSTLSTLSSMFPLSNGLNTFLRGLGGVRIHENPIRHWSPVGGWTEFVALI